MILYHDEIVQVSSRGCCAFLRLDDWRALRAGDTGCINLRADLQVDGETIPGADLRVQVDALGGVRIIAHPDDLELPEFVIRHYAGDPVYRA